MTKLEQLQNVVEVARRVEEFGLFQVFNTSKELKEFGGFFNYPKEDDSAKAVALLAETQNGDALGVTVLGDVKKLTPEQAAKLPTSAEWLKDNAKDFGKLKNKKEIGDAFRFSEEYTGEPVKSVTPLVYSVGTYGTNAAGALIETEAGAVKVVKATTRRNDLFRMI